MHLYNKLVTIFILILFPAFLSASSTTSLQVNFTKEEKNWILNHQTINFTGDPNWLPFEAFTPSGEYIGIVADTLKVVEQKTNLKFKKIQTESWSKSVELLKDGSVDMLTETTDSTLGSDFLFSNHFFSSPIVVITLL